MATSMQRQRVLACRPRFFPFRDSLCACERWACDVFSRLRLLPRRALPILAIGCLSAAIFSVAQQVQFSQGFSGEGQNGSRSPAESNAYAAAVSQPNPAVRISAIEQFLNQYPNSSLRQQAVSQLVLARRQSRGAAARPPGATIPASPAQPAPAPVVAPAAEPVSRIFTAPRNSLLQQPPKPAQVSFTPNSLTVKADNSTLSQILHEIAASTGMKVEGLAQDQRIFGSYGPGEPRVVLLSLLEGSGYNVVMIGDTAGGAPRELSLTQRTAGAPSVASTSIARNSSQDDDDDQDVPQTPVPEPPQLPGNPQNPEGAQPRSPQEIQQELMRLRQQQMQQQLPPAPQQ